MTPARVGIVVVAAGSGARLEQPQPKAFVPVHGRSILELSLDPILGLVEPAQVVVVAPAAQVRDARGIVERVAGAVSGFFTVVAGGATRQQSVAAGIAALDAAVEVVLVHDCARPFAPTTLFEAVIAAVRETGDGVIPGLAVADTLKRTGGGFATETVDRSTLAAVQTPQGFPRAELVAAYAAAIDDYTDDAALFSAAGHAVRVIPGDALAYKITTPWDLRRAHDVAGSTGPDTVAGSRPRTGVGIDVHGFDADAPLWLGGLFWPGEPGLAGHSDGDAVAHAICDALFSAAGLGDMGSRFGTDDPRFDDARGEVFLRETTRILAAAGFTVGNVAVQVIASAPRFAPRRAEVEERLTRLLGAPVSVSATTSDGLGFTGRGEGVCAIATALVYGTG